MKPPLFVAGLRENLEPMKLRMTQGLWMSKPTVAGALSMFVLAAAMSINWSSAHTVTIIATEYRFDPSDLALRVAVPYRLHLENRGKELHEFTAPAFFKTVELGNPDALNQERTEIVLQPGEHKDLYFVPEQAGRYPFFCADHDWAGMTGEIVVQ